jgi:hypothetical protein
VTIATARSAERFRDLRKSLATQNEAAFLDHEQSVTEADPDFQFCLVGDESGLPIGIGYSVPIDDFRGWWSGLPEGGLDIIPGGRVPFRASADGRGRCCEPGGSRLHSFARTPGAR